MGDFRTSVFKAGLRTFYATGAHRALEPIFGGLGAILMLHHVRPVDRRTFAPNSLLEITPDYLDAVLTRVRARGFDIVPMDEVNERLAAGSGKRFLAITFDDGYKDTLIHAHPILARHKVPYTIYVPTSFIDHIGELWWVVLERTIRSQRAVTATMNGRVVHFDCSTPALKAEAYGEIYWWLRGLPETELRSFVRDLSFRHGIDFRDICKRLCMTWDDLQVLAADPLVTIGAHTVNHYMLAKFPIDLVKEEIVRSRDILEERFGRPVKHFAYPVGDPTSAGPREFELTARLGFETAVTTRPGLLYAEHAAHATALPRVSLNGHFQSLRYLDVFLSGAPFALFNRFKRVNAA